MTYPNDQGNSAGAIPVYMAGSPVSALKTGISINGSVGTTSAAIIPAGTFSQWATVQNTHATQTLRISFNNPATANDIGIGPGQGFTLPFGFSGALYGLGSGAATTYAIVGI